ncbi:MAG: hypothetical protein M1837_003780 [Sclerophora amabilis]|nr:MAG: hypothetical protein M1837_003780 [Sclerophora amabilis]
MLSNIAVAVLVALVPLTSAQSGSGVTTRYWDCCKPSCAWPGKADVTNPVRTCDVNDNPLADPGVKSGCEDGGNSYMCSDNSPWAVNDHLSYGFAAASIAGSNEASWCCDCYELTFTSGPVSGKQMVVQVTNTGGDLGQNHFDIAMPGGGVGLFNGCTKQYGAPSSGWGEQYGGIRSAQECAAFNPKIKAGCEWRFGWFQNANNPR